MQAINHIIACYVFFLLDLKQFREVSSLKTMEQKLCKTLKIC